MAANMINALIQSDAIRSEAKFQSAMAKINERRAQLQAEDAIARGESEAGRYGEKVKQVVGQQKVSFAAQGVALDSGSVQAVQEDTMRAGQADVDTIRTNAFREAMGFKTQAQDYGMQSRMVKSTAQARAAGTLLAGGIASAQQAGKILAGGM